ncbi:UNVERIFIED_CONTAM: bud emergence protein 1 [Siphonaria sp. JEL0065]|nr:bud emergence protein 1 [Siphonaria sp. JEL0065]
MSSRPPPRSPSRPRKALPPNPVEQQQPQHQVVGKPSNHSLRHNDNNYNTNTNYHSQQEQSREREHAREREQSRERPREDRGRPYFPRRIDVDESSTSRYSDADVHSLYDTDAVYGESIVGDESRIRRRNEIELDEDDSLFNDSTVGRPFAVNNTNSNSNNSDDLYSINNIHANHKSDFYSVASSREANSGYYDRPPARLEDRSSMGSTVRDRDSVATERMSVPHSQRNTISPSRYNNYYVPPSANHTTPTSPNSINSNSNNNSNNNSFSTSTQRQLPPRTGYNANQSNTLPLPSTTSALLSPTGTIRSNESTFIVPSSPRTTSHPVDVYRTPPSKIVKAVGACIILRFLLGFYLNAVLQIAEYKAKSVSELSFVAGDFFYVVSEDHAGFFEVVNPAAKLRGLVPRIYFESLEKAGQRFSAEQRSRRVEENRTYANPSPSGSIGSGSGNGRATDSSPVSRYPPPPSPDTYYYTPPQSGKSPGRGGGEGLRSPASADSFQPPPRSARAVADYKQQGDDGTGMVSRSHSGPKTRQENEYGVPAMTQPPRSRTPIREHTQLPIPPANHFNPPIGRNSGSSNDEYVPPPRTVTRDIRRGDEYNTTPLQRMAAASLEAGSSSYPQVTRSPSSNQPLNQQYQNMGRTPSNGPQLARTTSNGPQISRNTSNGGPQIARTPSSGYNPPQRQVHQPPLPVTQNHLHRRRPSNPNNQQSQQQVPPTIQNIYIPTYRQFHDIRYYYRIHLTFSNSQSQILYRTHDDFWALQVSLLNFFPAESGRTSNNPSGASSSPRIIPFLPAPTLNARDVSARTAQSLQKRLEKYLQELIHLPPQMQASAMWHKFFDVRVGVDVYDVEFPTQEDLEGGVGMESVTSLLNEYSMNGDTILVRIAGPVSGNGKDRQHQRDMFSMEVVQDISYNELLDEVERRYGGRIEGLDYFDESGYLLPLYGNTDLGVLVRTNSDDLSEYHKEASLDSIQIKTRSLPHKGTIEKRFNVMAESPSSSISSIYSSHSVSRLESSKNDSTPDLSPLLAHGPDTPDAIFCMPVTVDATQSGTNSGPGTPKVSIITRAKNNIDDVMSTLKRISLGRRKQDEQNLEASENIAKVASLDGPEGVKTPLFSRLFSPRSSIASPNQEARQNIFNPTSPPMSQTRIQNHNAPATVLSHTPSQTRTRRASLTEITIGRSPSISREGPDIIRSATLQRPTTAIPPSTPTIAKKTSQGSIMLSIANFMKPSTLSHPSSISSSVGADLELEGPIFNTLISASATIAGKNGIPDVVIECVEYIEQRGLLKTEGLYRVPGNIKRVKELVQMFSAPYRDRNGSISLSRNPQVKRHSSASLGSANKLPAVEDPVLQKVLNANFIPVGGWSILSIVANDGGSKDGVDIMRAGPIEGMPSAKHSRSTTFGNTKSTFSLGVEESKRGVGLWGGTGLYGTVGFPIILGSESPGTIASLLKKFVSGVMDGFIPEGFWDEMDNLAMQNANQHPTVQIIQTARELLQAYMPSPHHLHTVAYISQHLHHVAAYSDTNLMTCKNLSLCFFASAKEGGEFLIQHANLIFDNVDLVGRDVVAQLPFSADEQQSQLCVPMLTKAKSEGYLNQWLSNHVALHNRIVQA